MKKLRKASVLALAVLIFASAMASTAFAGTTNRFLFQYIGGEDNMYVIMDNPNGAEAPEAGALALTHNEEPSRYIFLPYRHFRVDPEETA